MNFDSATLIAVRRVFGMLGVHVPPFLQLPRYVAATARILRLHLVRYAETQSATTVVGAGRRPTASGTHTVKLALPEPPASPRQAREPPIASMGVTLLF